MFLGLPDPDILVKCMDPDPSIVKQKNKKKTLIPTVLRLLLDFLSFKKDVNVPSKKFFVFVNNDENIRIRIH